MSTATISCKPGYGGEAVCGAVVAAKRAAAEVGADVLRAGGNAADAAVAVAAALSVVDPANCGIGGYGGFAVVSTTDGAIPSQISFNTSAPAATQASERTRRPTPGALVTPPAVVAGLCALHERFGRLPAEQVWGGAIALARAGVEVDQDLAAALAWAAAKHRGLNPAFRAVFFDNGQPLPLGAWLLQPDLAAVLETISRRGVDGFYRGNVASALILATEEQGGSLTAADFQAVQCKAESAECFDFAGAKIWAADSKHSGSGALFEALRVLQLPALGDARSRSYVQTVGSALAEAARLREREYGDESAARSQTSHFCVADADGMLVSMTFTHGPSWFGSGLVAADTGVILNAGAHLLVRRRSDGKRVAAPYLCPVVVHHGSGHLALGSPGGWRIPAIVLQAVLDRVHYRFPVERLLEGARVSLGRGGGLEAEDALRQVLPDLGMGQISTSEYYGPAGVLEVSGGSIVAATDPRFNGTSIVVH